MHIEEKLSSNRVMKIELLAHNIREGGINSIATPCNSIGIISENGLPGKKIVKVLF